MADDVTVDNGDLTDFPVATDDVGGGVHAQLVKLAYSADGTRTHVPADADGLLVNLGTNNDVSFSQNRTDTSDDSAGLTTATTLYTAGDQLGTILEFTNMAAASGGGGWIGTISLLCDVPSVISGVRLWFFSGSVTLASDNAAFSITDADMAKYQGHVFVPTPVGATNNAAQVVSNVNLDYECDATSLFCAMQTTATHTAHFAAADDIHIGVKAYLL